jgi:hypothetical protein
MVNTEGSSKLSAPIQLGAPLAEDENDAALHCLEDLG